MERVSCRPELLTGTGALGALEQVGAKRLFLVTGESPGHTEAAEQVRRAAGLPQTEIFPVGEPTVRRAVEGMVRLKAWEPDLVAAVGGRGAMDCAKAMVCFAGGAHPLTVIPTAFGAGTEVTDRTRLLHEGRFHTLQDDAMAPGRVILDPALTAALTREQTAEGGFAILAAALECRTARNRGGLAQTWAREAFCGAWAAISAGSAGNRDARHRMQLAGILTGLAGGSGCGLCGALCDSLGAVFSLPPERFCSVLLPVTVEYSGGRGAKQYAAMARACGMGGSEAAAPQTLKLRLMQLRRELGLPQTLNQAGIPPERLWGNIRRIVELTLEDPASRAGPLGADDFLVRRILESAAGR